MQGCGKTTLVELLEALFAHNSIRAASVSIDDFYLTFADQQALAQVCACCRPLLFAWIYVIAKCTSVP
jgi:pantothenate kinase-related protein Tda10